MNLLLPFFLLIAAFAFGDVFDQDGSGFDSELNESDYRALREFVNSKRDIPLTEKATKMNITGDVRAEWRHLNETGRKGNILGKQKELRGGRAVDYASMPISRNDIDAEFNLYFDYKTDRSWAVAQLQFDNSTGVFDNNKKCSGSSKNSPQGIRDKLANGNETADPDGWHGSGRCDKICLKKAYFGYNLYQEADGRVDIEIGRRRLYNVFDSQIQFLSQFDGITFKLSDKVDFADTWLLNVAGFVVNERINHFGFVAEAALLNIKETGIDLKYSFTHWKKNGRAQCFNDPKANKPPTKKGKESTGYLTAHNWTRDPLAFRFLISQVALDYTVNPDYVWGKKALFYGAYLYNHDQKNTTFLARNKKYKVARDLNTGWYIGFEIGSQKMKSEGDWSFNVEYDYVNPLVVPDGDCRGFGRGNTLDESFTSVERGNTNFKGWKFQFLYNLTDNITVDTIVEWTKAVRPEIGGHHTYSKFEIETIYAF